MSRGAPNVPVYVYRRWDGSTFETKQRMAEDALLTCPTTGQSVERVLQPFTPRYTGTGFYATDHRTPNGNRQSPGPPGDGERSRRGDSAHETGGAAVQPLKKTAPRTVTEHGAL